MFCPNCGRQASLDSNFCFSCGAVQTTQHVKVRAAGIVRPRHPRMVAGVCSGFAIYYGWDVSLVRILFAALTCLTTGFGILVYLAAWVILPDAQYALPQGVVPQSAQNTTPGQGQSV